MAEVIQYNAELKWVKRGQYRPYDDMHYICEIHTEEEIPEKDILLLVENGRRLPKAEWNIRSKQCFDDIFRGYYTIEKTDYGYRYYGVDPYDD